MYSLNNKKAISEYFDILLGLIRNILIDRYTMYIKINVCKCFIDA